MKKTILFLMLAMVFTLAGNDAKAQTWVPMDTVNNVLISYYEESNCVDSAAVFLKIENTNNAPVSVTWSLWTGSLPKTVSLIANETIEGYCSDSSFLIMANIPTGMTTSTMTPDINVQ